MLVEYFCLFFLGNLIFQIMAFIPTFIWIVFCIILAFSLINSYSLRILCALLLGFTYSATYASWVSYSRSTIDETKPCLIRGYITSVPIETHWQTSFDFELENWGGKIHLSWQKPRVKIRVGEKWQLYAKLKRIHGTQNSAGYDYEAWAFENKLTANGHVLDNENDHLISYAGFYYPSNQIRQWLKENIKAHLPSLHSSPWLMALLIGERHEVTHTDWQVLRNTGTNHLMAIAGLHLGMVALFARGVIQYLWKKSIWLTLRIPAPIAAATGAWLIAVTYSALAGWLLPTERACLMLSIMLAAIISRKKMLAWSIWLGAIFVVLIINPFSPLAESFWLSFMTIAFIIYGMGGRLAPSGIWWKWGRLQWVITIGLIPLSLFFFQECSLISYVVNSIAIPWLGFLILPFCILSLILIFPFPSLAHILLWCAGESLEKLWKIMTWFSQQEFSIWHHAKPSLFILILSMLSFILIFLPKGIPGRFLGFITLLPLCLGSPEKPHPGEYWLTLLDVGQGLSVIIQTAKHILIFDTGPNFNSKDMGESVVLPYLRSINTHKIDMLVISHGDNDHIGGANTLLHALPVEILKTSVPEKFPDFHAAECLAGMNWQWDGVNFRFLYPFLEDLKLGNNSSCVLQIDNGKHQVLLTGDIEKYAEARLVATQQFNLAADILIAPHHGSKTSSTEEFVEAVHPRYVLYATGYRNRYHFPHAKVVKLYQEKQAIQLNTAQTGLIQFKLDKNFTKLTPMLYRMANRKYWFD